MAMVELRGLHCPLLGLLTLCESEPDMQPITPEAMAAMHPELFRTVSVPPPPAAFDAQWAALRASKSTDNASNA